MSKTNDTRNLSHDTLENRVLADSELELVSGGLIVKMNHVSVANVSLGGMTDPPANAATMAVWNDLLRQNGF